MKKLKIEELVEFKLIFNLSDSLKIFFLLTAHIEEYSEKSIFFYVYSLSTNKVQLVLFI